MKNRRTYKGTKFRAFRCQPILIQILEFLYIILITSADNAFYGA